MKHLPALSLPMLLLGAALAAQSPAPPLVIQATTVIDATGASPKRDVSILIEDGRIREIGAVVRAPKHARIVDGKGKFVIPGLADMHVHTVSRQRMEQFPPLFIANGVT